MSTELAPGTKQVIGGRLRVYYEGYWIKAYDVPADTLLAKKFLIEAMTRRLFKHVEHGLNVPGTRLDEARQAYEREADPRKKRVKGAMVAGALFNRAADVFTKLVDLQALGVEIQPDNALMRQCGDHLQEALTFGKMVLHRSGEEGIDELWGEPFKAFAYPVEDFYKSRYVKIALTMRGIDTIAEYLVRTLSGHRMFAELEPLVAEFICAAKEKCETLRSDPDIFDLWASFVVSAEKMGNFAPLRSGEPSLFEDQRAALGIELIRSAKDLVLHTARARVPMPKTTAEFIERCERYRATFGPPPRRSAAQGRLAPAESAPSPMMARGSESGHKS
jgi:hypothetical protein